MYWIRCSWTRSKTSYAVVVEKKPPTDFIFSGERKFNQHSDDIGDRRYVGNSVVNSNASGTVLAQIIASFPDCNRFDSCGWDTPHLQCRCAIAIVLTTCTCNVN